MKLIYDLWYRNFRVPWDTGPRQHLMELVESGRIPPGRAIDLGSGTASNCVFLAQHGFEVTGVDYAPSAIEMGRSRAEQAGVQVDFVEDDLTNLQHVTGTFDLLVDYGTLDDLLPKGRKSYLQNVLPLTKPGSEFLLYCHEWPKRKWERLLPFLSGSMEPGEVERRFGRYFDIERIDGELKDSGWVPGWAVYLMTRTNGRAP